MSNLTFLIFKNWKPVRIDKEKDKNNTDRYSITPVDFEVRLNLPPLYEIFRTYKKEASKSRLWFKVFR